jgi:hypothetical protein
MEATPGYTEFFKRVQGKHSAKIHGGGLHSFENQLNLSSSVHHITQLSS